MSLPIAVLRPEPGNRVTAAAVEAAGRRAIRLPLFEIVAVPWEAPDPERFDALILTSANAIRHAGPSLGVLADLPVHAVGRATAEAARRAGLRVEAIGEDGAAGLIAEAERAGVRRALHLAGRERTLETGGIVADVLTIYASDPVDVPSNLAAELNGTVAMIHSARAGMRFAEIAEKAGAERSAILIAAIGARAGAAAGPGWAEVAWPGMPDPEALLALALRLAD